MITTFQASGVSAGTAKCSKLLSIPTTTPVRASSRTIGNRICDSVTVSGASSGRPGMNRGMTTGARRMKTARERAEHEKDQEDHRGRHAEGLAPVSLLQQLAEHGHEGALKRHVRHQRPDQVGHLEGHGERGHLAGRRRSSRPTTISRASPAIRERPVATAKNAVFRPRRRSRWAPLSGCPPASAPPVPCSGPGSGTSAAIVRRRRERENRVAAMFRHGKHRLTRKAHPAGGARAAGEPAVHLCREDVLPPPRGGRFRGRCRTRRRGAEDAQLADRPRRRAGRHAQEHRRAQEGPGAAALAPSSPRARHPPQPPAAPRRTYGCARRRPCRSRRR